ESESGELWDLLDVDGRATGRVVRRADQGDPGGNLAPGDCHRVVACGVFGPDGRLLVQQRAADKPNWPNLWDLTAGGSVLAGETGRQAVARELFEEVGLVHDFTGLSPTITVNRESGPLEVYLIEADVDLSTLVLQASEVQAVGWATREEVDGLVRAGRFALTGSFMALLFDLRAWPDVEVPDH
ncbi:MAG: NUDIX domain-containing protein, partial [Propionibacteriaceae bacterium]|nr:NUDIX domain-containing protein [Propionibacteriaceae bacterium]